MKSIFTLLLISIIAVPASSQQWKILGGYNLGIPLGELNDNINPVHSLQTGARYQLDGKLKRLSIIVEGGLGIYAMQRIDQTFTFDNTSAIVPVNYNSNALNANLALQYDLADGEKFIVPYVNVKGGYYSLFSNIYVENPRDGVSCHALQQENIIKDGTFTWSAGTGVQLNAALFAKNKYRREISIDIGVNYLRGGSLDYINTKRLIDAQTINQPGSKPLQVQFINASTQNIHEHTVAQVYNSKLRMVEVRLGVVVEINR